MQTIPAPDINGFIWFPDGSNIRQSVRSTTESPLWLAWRAGEYRKGLKFPTLESAAAGLAAFGEGPASR